MRLHDPHASRTSADVVRLVLDAVNRRDADTLVELLDPDVELFPILASLDDLRVLRTAAGSGRSPTG